MKLKTGKIILKFFITQFFKNIKLILFFHQGVILKYEAIFLYQDSAFKEIPDLIISMS